MSELRTKLSTAKKDYLSVAYPGDLVGDISVAAWPAAKSGGRGRWGLGGWSGVGTAVAASLAVVALLKFSTTGPSSPTGPSVGSIAGQAPVARWIPSGSGQPVRPYSNVVEDSAMTGVEPREVIFTTKVPGVQQGNGQPPLFFPVDPRFGGLLPPNDPRAVDYTIPKK